jgi:hypothetical protein
MEKPVKIFGTVKIYKNERSIQGAKMIPLTENEFILHLAEVAHSWMFLTGNLNENVIFF